MLVLSHTSCFSFGNSILNSSSINFLLNLSRSLAAVAASKKTKISQVTAVAASKKKQKFFKWQLYLPAKKTEISQVAAVSASKKNRNFSSGSCSCQQKKQKILAAMGLTRG
ncbi:hypothetical protein CDIK_3129 [Cucumispora dikerogammari]|nr:hypothetical protein CDIK_3129 [Cucumispora dikerogammari]